MLTGCSAEEREDSCHPACCFLGPCSSRLRTRAVHGALESSQPSTVGAHKALLQNTLPLSQLQWTRPGPEWPPVLLETVGNPIRCTVAADPFLACLCAPCRGDGVGRTQMPRGPQ